MSIEVSKFHKSLVVGVTDKVSPSEVLLGNDFGEVDLITLLWDVCSKPAQVLLTRAQAQKLREEEEEQSLQQQTAENADAISPDDAGGAESSVSVPYSLDVDQLTLAGVTEGEVSDGL